MTEYASADELGQATGFFITVPASATDVTYSSIAGDDNPIAQAKFMLGGVDVTLRYKSTSSLEDISGMYYTWGNTKDFADSLGNTCTLNYNENEAASITSYYRVIGASCSVSMTGTDLHYDKIMSIYQQIADASTIGDQTAA